MVLTSKQREELNEAVLEYLTNSGYDDSADCFQRQVGLQKRDTQATGANSDILEKKWVSIVRLQKKIIQLQSQIQHLQEQLRLVSKSGGQGKISLNGLNSNNTDEEDLIQPKLPAKHTLCSHRASVIKVVFHPEFTQLASCSEDGSVKLWDFQSGQLERTLKGHTGTVNGIAYDSIGKTLISCSSDMTIKIWELATYNCIKTLNGHEHSVSCVQFINNNDFILSGSRDQTIKLWEVNTGYCQKTFEGHDEWVRDVVVSETLPNVFASCSNDQTICIWSSEVPTHSTQVLKGHDHVIECIIFIPIQASQNILSKADYCQQYSLNGGGGGGSALGSTVMQQESKESSPLTSSEITVHLLASGSRDQKIQIWNTVTGTCLITLQGHDNWLRGLTLHKNGQYLYSSSDDQTIRIWDLYTGKNTQQIIDAHNHFISSITYSGQYTTIATCSVDNSIQIWDLK